MLRRIQYREGLPDDLFKVERMLIKFLPQVGTQSSYLNIQFESLPT